jgi:hypothetical protein
MALRKSALLVAIGIVTVSSAVTWLAFGDSNPTAVANPATMPAVSGDAGAANNAASAGASNNGAPNNGAASNGASNTGASSGNGGAIGTGAPTATPVIVGKETGSSSPNPPTTPQRGGHNYDAAPTSLQNAMNQMLDLDFDVKKDYADPANMNQTLREIAFFERDVAYCKLHLAPSVNKLDGDDKVTETDSYRVMMSSMMRTLLDLEDAVHDKKFDDAKKLLATIDEIEEQGHAEFIPP